MDVGALAVAHEPASAALVRSAIAADLEQQAIAPRAVDNVVLVASELVGNAVVHTRSSLAADLAVTWDVEDHSVVVRVRDASGELPHRRTTTETETGGRGLAIVAAIAADWGVSRTDEGKQVWARVPVVRAPGTPA